MQNKFKRAITIMKKIFLLLVAFLTVVPCFAQSNSRVTLKNGSALMGTLIELDPASHIVLNIAGIPTRIEMSEIASIEGSRSVPNTQKESSMESDSDYPAEIVLNVGPFQLEMILIKGGQFSMGYDGPGSRKMKSEPVHDVFLNDFYVNKEPITEDMVSYLKYNEIEHRGSDYYSPGSWKDADRIANMLAQITTLPVRLITEAQWEYLATGSERWFLKYDLNECNYCYDYLEPYVKTRTQVDPTGPQSGVIHVRRSFRWPEFVQSRTFSKTITDHYAIRVTIPASALSHIGD